MYSEVSCLKKEHDIKCRYQPRITDPLISPPTLLGKFLGNNIIGKFFGKRIIGRRNLGNDFT